MKLLFISHDAKRAGAPLLLLYILAWLKKNTHAEMQIILLQGGDLEQDFKRFGKVLVLETTPNKAVDKVLNRLMKYFFSRFIQQRQVKAFEQYVNKFNPDVTYANTALSLAFMNKVKPRFRTNLICHLHELEYMIQSTIGIDKFRKSLPLAKKIICVAEMLKQNLIQRYGIADDKVSLIYEPIEIRQPQKTSGAIRIELGIPEDAFVVVSSGIGGFRKGTDIFIQTAGLVVSKDAQIYFLWVGSIDRRSLLMYEHDCEKLGIKNRVIFSGVTAQPESYFAAADLFFLSSREDPYPLVCLEAAAQGKPIICFENAGGMPEFVKGDAGIAVPYLNVGAVAEKVHFLKNNPDQMKIFGNIAKARAITTSSIDVIGPQIWHVIEKIGA